MRKAARHGPGIAALGRSVSSFILLLSSRRSHLPQLYAADGYTAVTSRKDGSTA